MVGFEQTLIHFSLIIMHTGLSDPYSVPLGKAVNENSCLDFF